MSLRHHLAVALLAVSAAAPVQAQFTATVAPPRREKPPAQVVAEAQEAAKADTARRTQLKEMRAWVDSAAQAATGRPVVRQDSSASSVDPGAPAPIPTVPPATQVPDATVEMPETATPLPLLALAGVLLLGAGAAMVRREPVRATSRRRTSRGA